MATAAAAERYVEWLRCLAVASGPALSVNLGDKAGKTEGSQGTFLWSSSPLQWHRLGELIHPGLLQLTPQICPQSAVLQEYSPSSIHAVSGEHIDYQRGSSRQHKDKASVCYCGPNPLCWGMLALHQWSAIMCTLLSTESGQLLICCIIF